MDGRGRWMDNVFIERLWRSVKHEEVHLKGYESVPEVRRELAAYCEFCNPRRNTRRRHQRLADQPRTRSTEIGLRTEQRAA